MIVVVNVGGSMAGVGAVIAAKQGADYLALRMSRFVWRDLNGRDGTAFYEVWRP